MGNFLSCLHHLTHTKSSLSIRLLGSSNHLHEDPGGTTEDLPSSLRTNQDPTFIDNNCNDGRMDRVFILTEIHSNCQEESDIQLEDSSPDNNCNQCHSRTDFIDIPIIDNFNIIIDPP